MSTKKPPSHKLFEKYHFLVKIYANKLFSASRISFEKKDIEQELSIRLFSSISSYALKWGEYKRTGKRKPVPILYYLQNAMNNRIIDFSKKVQKSQHNEHISSSGNDSGFDIGYSKDMSNSITNTSIIIGGVDLLSGLKNQKEKACFVLFLKGYTKNKLNQMFEKSFNASDLINKQIKHLKNFEQEMVESASVQKFVSFKKEEAA